jgi:hypothetical protein
MPLWLVPVLALAGCGGAGFGSSPAPASSGSATGSTGSFMDRMSSGLFGAPAKPGQGRVEQENPECPPVDVRQGASTVTIYGSGEHAATNVRYQATTAQMARECAVLAGTMTMKVGLQGRVVLGPVGGAGRLDLPVRFAVVQEGPNPKTIWTKLYRIPVDVPAGQTNVPFVHVEENITFPIPKGEEIDAYVVYVGFDQTGAKEDRRPRAKKRSQAQR